MVWGTIALVLVLAFSWWVSARRLARAFARWVEANPTAFDIPSPFSPSRPCTPLPQDPASSSFFLAVFLTRWVTPVLNRRAESVQSWWDSEEHDRLVVLLRVTGALPRIPVYLTLCLLAAVGVFAFVPSIFDLDLPELEE